MMSTREWENHCGSLDFVDGYFYETKFENVLYVFRVMSFHRGEYIVKQYLPYKEMKPVNLANDEIIRKMTKEEFVERYPEYVI